MITRLTRIDPVQNMHRFYCLSVQPDLFGGFSLIREWGRIGRSSQLRIEYFESKEKANHASNLMAKRKRKKGYI